MAKINYRVGGTKPPFLVELLQNEMLIASQTHEVAGEGNDFSFDNISEGSYTLKVTDAAACVDTTPVTLTGVGTEPNWADTGNFRCVTEGGLNTGQQEKEQISSDLYGQTRWVPNGENLTACPIAQEPEPIVNAAYEITGSTETYTDIAWTINMQITHSQAQTYNVRVTDNGAIWDTTITVSAGQLSAGLIAQRYYKHSTDPYMVSFEIMPGQGYVIGQVARHDLTIAAQSGGAEV